MIDACRAFGAKIEQQPDRLIIEGVGGQLQVPDDIIDAGNSGIVYRFIACLACLLDQEIVITGDHSIRHNRPIKPLIDAMPKLGASIISKLNNNHAPIVVKGPMKAGQTTIIGKDSQPVSGLLIAAALTEGTTQIDVEQVGEEPWVQLTLDWFDRLGIDYQQQNYQHYQITGKAQIKAFDYEVAGDLSALAFPLVAALITNSEITIHQVDLNDPQGDKAIVDTLINMGAKFEIDAIKRTLKVCHGSTLTGIEFNINDFVDALPVMAVIGCFAQGTTTITGAEIARHKECDRLAAITAELTKMGATIEEHIDGLVIQQSALTGATIDSHHDHRIIMAIAVAALRADGITTINDTDWVNKSYPTFDQDLAKLGVNIERQTWTLF